jgi:uncharacterized protein YlzI (FlbEa/FlbD family)
LNISDARHRQVHRTVVERLPDHPIQLINERSYILVFVKARAEEFLARFAARQNDL